MMEVRANGQPAQGATPTHRTLRRMAGVGMLSVSILSLGLALSWAPLAPSPASAASVDSASGMSPAAAAARALLNAPRPAPPTTTNAGMGTAEPARRAEITPQVGGVDAAGNGETISPTRPVSAAPATAAPIAPAPIASAPAPAAPATARPAPAGGVDSAGNGETAPRAAQTVPNPTPAAPAPGQAAAAQPAPTATARPTPAQASAPQTAAPVAASAPNPAAQPGGIPAPEAVKPVQASTALPSTPPAAGAPMAGAPMTPPVAPPVVAAPAVTGPLAPVAEAIVVQIAQPSELGATRKETEALVAFYTARQGLPVFVTETGVNARGTAVLARLAAAEDDGLDPAAYAVAKPTHGADAATLAATELKLAVAALTYARHAQSGRFEPSRISEMVTPTREIPDPAAILASLSTVADANATLAAFNPTHTGYKQLKAKLAALKHPKAPTQVVITPGELLKPGDSDPRVPALRTRLGLSGVPGDLYYDATLVTAVKSFQDSVRLKPTGVIGATTVNALNRGTSAAPSADAKADIIANMERWRWLPRDLGAYYVWVNIPEYMARIHEGDRVIHETRIVVGKKETPTPLLSQDMRYAVVNPAWNIPPSIARNEMMPLLRSDPGALERRGIEVVRNGSGGYTFRQSPGERNALGRIKFMFPNDHSVYLHDTPSKTLFSRDQRAFSHGCMRVQDPLEFGEVLFNIGLPGESWTAERIGKMFGGKERYVTLKQRIPVHVVYFTTFVNENGRLETRDDLYGINAEVKSRLGLDGATRRMADGGAPRR